VDLTPVFAQAPGAVRDRRRLEAELAEVESALARARDRVESADFLAKAPEKVVAGARKNLDELAEKRRRLTEALEAAAAGGG
jgi:valyl-tRNA synthetase